jgi:hypothetical protein
MNQNQNQSHAPSSSIVKVTLPHDRYNSYFILRQLHRHHHHNYTGSIINSTFYIRVLTLYFELSWPGKLCSVFAGLPAIKKRRALSSLTATLDKHKKDKSERVWLESIIPLTVTYHYTHSRIDHYTIFS